MAEVLLTAAQQRAVDERAERIALSAGAGSGKTSVLVERFLALVDAGAPPTEILAVTFTERAAAEMKERIIARFEARGDEENRRRTEAAYISTIHGLCARLLRENPLAARLDPAFGIMDALTRGIFLDEQHQALYADEWFQEAVDRFGAGRDAVYPTLFTLIQDAALKPREFGRDAPEEAGFDVEAHVAAAMQRVDAFCRAEWCAARDRLLAVADVVPGMQVNGPARTRQHAAFCAALEALRESTDVDRELAARICDNTGFTGGAGHDPHVEDVRRAIKDVRDTFKRYLDFDRAAEERLEREVIAPLKVGTYRRAAQLRDRYDAFKREQGLLDFEDLQRRAVELLQDDAVRCEYAGRFRHIVLDEAQDTNPVQMRILERLLDGGNHLFAVGDLKQSIYGFRGADVGLFRDLCRSAGDGYLTLADNFRSRREIIGLVNAIGEWLWEDGAVPFEPLEARLEYPDGGSHPHVELRLFRKTRGGNDDEEADDESADEVRVREGTVLARWIRTAVEGDGDRAPLQVFDRRTNAMRPARYGDIAILTRTRTPVPIYERALAREGIPYVKDGGRGFFAGLEITDVLGALRVVQNPRDDFALLAVLRSPMFGWRDEDLLRLRLSAGGGRLWRALEGGFQPTSPRSSPDAYPALRALRAFRHHVPPSVLIEMLLERTQYWAALLQTPRGRAQVANLGKLIEFARTSTELDGASLARFVQRAALAERHLRDEADAALSSPDDDVVSLSTIHGAKGLEWPIVILPALELDFAGSRSGSSYSAPDGILVVEPKDEAGDTLKPLSHRAVREAVRTREEAEARRIFYVALTRAREYLLLSGQATYSQKPGEGRFARPVEWLARQLGLEDHGQGSHDRTLGETRLHLTFMPPEAGTDDVPSQIPDSALREARERLARGEPVGWAAAQGNGVGSTAVSVVDRLFAAPAPMSLPPMAGTPAATTVTRLTYFYRCPLVYYFDLVLQVEEHPRARGKAVHAATGGMTAVELGTRVHELLERADLGAEPHAEAERLAARQQDLADSDRVRITRMLANVLEDPLMDRVRGAVRVEREYPFYLDLGGTTVQGVIDLVFADPAGTGVVLDYKSNDLAAPDRVNVLTEYYRPQVELYALAVEKAGHLEPREAVLYFLNKPVARRHALDPARLEAVEAEAAGALGKIGRGQWDTEPGEKCRNCGYRKRGFCEVGKAWKG